VHWELGIPTGCTGERPQESAGHVSGLAQGPEQRAGQARGHQGTATRWTLASAGGAVSCAQRGTHLRSAAGAEQCGPLGQGARIHGRCLKSCSQGSGGQHGRSAQETEAGG